MSVFLIILLVLAIGLGLLVRQNRGAGKSDRRSSKTDASGKYHAVSVCMGTNPCKAVLTICHKRFLSAEAPGFPLPECDRSECSCCYEHHADRRTGRDRRDFINASGKIAGNALSEERRGWTDRRNRDLELDSLLGSDPDPELDLTLESDS